MHSSIGSQSGEYAGRYSTHACPRSFAQADGTLTVMKLHVIKKPKVTGAQCGCEAVLAVESEDLAVDGSFTGPRGQEPPQREGTEDRNARSVIDGFGDCGAFPPWCPGIRAGHGSVDGKFVYEDQAQRGQRGLFGSKLRARYRVRFTGPPGLFFRVRASSASQRQTVLRLTLTRFFFLIPWRSSSRVASGWAATNSASTRRSSVASLALAPPPWGRGARSFFSRPCWSSL